MCFSNSPWVFIHSYIYLMQRVIMKIEFLSNALINQMTQAEHHLLWIVLKVNFSPKELLMKVIVITMAAAFVFEDFYFVHRCSLQ